MTHAWVGGLILVALAAGAPPVSAQSLWREGGPGGSLFADHRARIVDDVVSIIIVEESSSSRTGNTKTSKETSRSAAITKFPSALDPLARQLKPITNPALKGKSLSEFAESAFGFGLTGSASHEGKGAIWKVRAAGGTPSRKRTRHARSPSSPRRREGARRASPRRDFRRRDVA